MLLVTPDTQATLDVDTLASVFNLDKAELRYRTIPVDEFPIPGAVALLTTEDFFVVHDKVYTTTSFFNPQTLTTNYYLHHISVNSVSPFVPAVLFTTDAATTVPTVTQAVTGFELGTAGGFTSVKPGGTLQLIPDLVGTLTGTPQGNLEVAPDAAYYYSFTATDENGDIIVDALSPWTYVDRFNVLHVQEDLGADVISLGVTARAVYSNPSGATPALDTADLSLEIDRS